MPGVADVWARLSPQARTGVVAAGGAAAVLIAVKGRGAGAAAAPADPTDTGDGTTDSLTFGTGTDAISADQLATWESDIGDTLATLIDAIQAGDGGTPAVPAAGAGTRALKSDFIHPHPDPHNGESANDAAIRLRSAGQKTFDGRPLTGAYIVSINRSHHEPGWSGGGSSTKRWVGTHFVY